MKKQSILWILAVGLLLVGAAATGITAADDQAAAAMPTRWLPGDTTIGPAYNTQQAPDIAQGGDKTLIVWEDSRGIVAGGTESETGRDIYAMRLDSAGNLLDPTPIAVATGPASQTAPKAAWNGSNWLVVFQGIGPNGTGYYDSGLYAVRISPAGQVLDARPIPLHGTKPVGGFYWSLASDGSNWVVVVQGTSVSGDIVGLRISADGVVLDPPTRRLVAATYFLRSNIRLAYAGGVFLMTYNGSSSTEAVRFDANLNLLSAPAELLANSVGDLAGAGNQFYIVWNQQQPDYSVVVTGTRLNSAGQKLDGAGVGISGANPNGPYDVIAVTWDGLNWKVTWGNNGQLRVARVSSVGGQVLDPGGVAVAGPPTGLSAGTGNGGVQLVWSPYANADQGVATANINAGNVAGPTRDISLGAPRQVSPDIAAGSNGYMVAYLSSTGSNHRVLAQPLDAAGNPTTAEPVDLASGDLLYGPGAPAVAWNGSVYLVAWSSSAAGGVFAQRLNPDGSKVDPAPFRVMASAFGPSDVEAIGDTFLVLGRKCGYTCQYINLFGARVNGSSGAVIDSTPILLASGYINRRPAVTVLGGRWLVVYHSNWTHNDSNASTGALFVSVNGVVTSIGGLYGFSTAGGNGFFRIGLASNGSVALMAQSAEITSGVETDLLYRFIYPDGSLGAVVNLTPWRGNQYNPQVAWDGAHFVIVYEEQKNRPDDLDMLDGRSDLFGMRVAPNGVVRDPKGFVFSTSPVGETLPAVASPQNGVSLIAAALMRTEAPWASYRIGYGVFGSTGNQPPVAVATANPDGGDIPVSVSFSASGSADPDGSISAYSWDFGDGGASTLANPTHTYTAPGPFVAHLTVTDNVGAQTTQAILVRAVAPNRLPVAVAVAMPSSGPSPLDVTFSADRSYDPDGSIGNVTWTYHDGSYSYGPTGYYTYNRPGTYAVTLTVYDGRNATGTDSVTVVVGGSATPTPTPTPSPTPTPIATPTPTPTPIPGGCTNNCLRSTNIALTSRPRRNQVVVTGQVTVQSQTGAVVHSATVFATWTKPDGSTVNLSATTNSQGRAKFTTSGAPGTYTLQVTNIARSGWTFDPANSVLLATINARLVSLHAPLAGSRHFDLWQDTVANAVGYRLGRES